jgi:hypothetical protein
MGGICLRCWSLGLKLGPSSIARTLGCPVNLPFFAFGVYVMYISIFLYMLMYKDIGKFMSLHSRVPAPLDAVT